MARWFPSGRPEASRSREAITIALPRKRKRCLKEKSRTRRVTIIKATTTTGESHSGYINHKLEARRILSGLFLVSPDAITTLSKESCTNSMLLIYVRLENIGAR